MSAGTAVGGGLLVSLGSSPPTTRSTRGWNGHWSCAETTAAP